MHPGAVDPNVTQANLRTTICHPGYTKTVRPSASVTNRFKYEVAYPAYGEPHSKKTELDHLVSLELGGSNDAVNLGRGTTAPNAWIRGQAFAGSGTPDRDADGAGVT